jgi:bacteriocin-like protein
MNKRPVMSIDESKSNPQRVETAGEELSEEELRSVSGGIIFVGGYNNIVSQPSKSSMAHSDWQTLNHRTIPPDPSAKNQPGV